MLNLKIIVGSRRPGRVPAVVRLMAAPEGATT